ncbi:hypothetical protein FGO68_gene14606 [Halteria grandinella]|uniref:Uncharacterized protein n=1 Tax=Halteria grandinella TaxID=5974 RepID=A0A8J8NI16_HALGN|nr:hypothetical protein FGO68_gene14606 [Halteria grandinella]
MQASGEQVRQLGTSTDEKNREPQPSEFPSPPPHTGRKQEPVEPKSVTCSSVSNPYLLSDVKRQGLQRRPDFFSFFLPANPSSLQVSVRTSFGSTPPEPAACLSQDWRRNYSARPRERRHQKCLAWRFLHARQASSVRSSSATCESSAKPFALRNHRGGLKPVGHARHRLIELFGHTGCLGIKLIDGGGLFLSACGGSHRFQRFHRVVQFLGPDDHGLGRVEIGMGLNVLRRGLIERAQIERIRVDLLNELVAPVGGVAHVGGRPFDVGLGLVHDVHALSHQNLGIIEHSVSPDSGVFETRNGFRDVRALFGQKLIGIEHQATCPCDGFTHVGARFGQQRVGCRDEVIDFGQRGIDLGENALNFGDRFFELSDGSFDIRANGSSRILERACRFFKGNDAGLHSRQQGIERFTNFSDHVTDVMAFARPQANLFHNRVEETRFRADNDLPCHEFHRRRARADDVHHRLPCERGLDGDFDILLELACQAFGDRQPNTGTQMAVDFDEVHAFHPTARKPGDLNGGTDTDTLTVFEDDIDRTPVRQKAGPADSKCHQADHAAQARQNNETYKDFLSRASFHRLPFLPESADRQAILARSSVRRFDTLMPCPIIVAWAVPARFARKALRPGT